MADEGYLREFLVKRSSTDAKSQATLPAAFQAARAQLPANLNGLTFMNFQKVDYQALKARWIEQAKNPSAAAGKKAATASPDSPGSKVPDWLLNMNPEVFPRHLHFLAGASWKNSKGVHFDEWIE